MRVKLNLEPLSFPGVSQNRPLIMAGPMQRRIRRSSTYNCRTACPQWSENIPGRNMETPYTSQRL